MPAPTSFGDQRVPVVLAQLAAVLAEWYDGYQFVLVGYPPSKDNRFLIRVPCPPPTVLRVAPPPPQPESLADLILTALADADGPVTLTELARAATGGLPTGGFRDRLRQMVEAGQVRCPPGSPRTYDLPN